jgi:hypothetical protein
LAGNELRTILRELLQREVMYMVFTPKPLPSENGALENDLKLLTRKPRP